MGRTVGSYVVGSKRVVYQRLGVGYQGMYGASDFDKSLAIATGEAPGEVVDWRRLRGVRYVDANNLELRLWINGDYK